MERAFAPLQMICQDKVFHQRASLQFRQCQITATFTFIEPVLLHDVVLHLRCHLLRDGGQVGRLFPTRQVQRFGRSSTATTCLVLDVGLDELRGGVRNGLIGGRVAAGAGVAQAGAREHLHLVELVGEVDVAVDGSLGALLLVIAVAAVVGDAVGCDGWREETRSVSANAQRSRGRLADSLLHSPGRLYVVMLLSLVPLPLLQQLLMPQSLWLAHAFGQLSGSHSWL